MGWFKYDLEKFEIDEDVDVRRATSKDRTDIQTVMDLFNSEYDWSEMYDIEEAIRRIESDCICFLFYFNYKPIGIRWVYKVTKKDGFTFNLYMHKSRPEGYTQKCIRHSNAILKEELSSVIYSVNDWDKRALRNFEKVGHIKQITVSDAVKQKVAKYFYSG